MSHSLSNMNYMNYYSTKQIVEYRLINCLALFKSVRIDQASSVPCYLFIFYSSLGRLLHSLGSHYLLEVMVPADKVFVCIM